MSNLFFKSLQKYGEYEPFSSDTECIADTGARVKISQKGMKAFCTMMNMEYKENMENTCRIVVTINEENNVFYDIEEGE